MDEERVRLWVWTGIAMRNQHFRFFEAKAETQTFEIVNLEELASYKSVKAIGTDINYVFFLTGAVRTAEET